ncbi:MAG: hypothetical protein QOH58_3161 [Thermoleophilaceae bacterium]|nr:hypothetical protein [Thermoleophilaceae bacterium]
MAAAKRLTLTLALAALAVAAPAAAAAPLSLQVVNERGIAQVSLVQLTGAACPAGCTRLTNGYGRLALDVAPGDRVAVTRGSLAPEGAGVQYVVPPAVPATPVTFTLPTVLDATPASAHDADERWLLDRVNQERAALGRAPLQQAGPLNRASDAYARWLLANNKFDHTAYADPGVRAADQGWPVYGGVGETLALAPSKETALALWKGSAPHWTLLMMDGLTVAGVGRAGNRWVMMPAACAPTDAPERCEVGGSGVLPPLPQGGGAGTGQGQGQPQGEAKGQRRRARLRVRLHRDGRKLTVAVRLVEGRGKVEVAVRQGRRRARVRGHREHRIYRAVTTLPRTGRWKVAIRFEGVDGWSSRRLQTRTVRVH